MALINHRAREISFKLVYYGPGLGGKTTNLQILHQRLPVERRGRLLSISTDHERTLFFDFLPIELGTVNGLLTRFHLYTVPGQVYYRLSRRAVLRGMDGVVFVADSHPAREQSNRESLLDLDEHLIANGMTPEERRRMPRVFQYNKRDLPAAMPIERMRALLNPGGEPEFEAVASEGKGVSETLRTACKLMLARLTGPQPVAGAAPAATTGVPATAPAAAIAAREGASVAAPAPAGAATASDPAAAPTAAAHPVGPAGRAGAVRSGAETLARPPAVPPVRSV